MSRNQLRVLRLTSDWCIHGFDGAEGDVEVSAKPRGGLRGAVDVGDVAVRVDLVEVDVFRRGRRQRRRGRG